MLYKIVIYIYRSLSYQKEGGAVDASVQRALNVVSISKGIVNIG